MGIDQISRHDHTTDSDGGEDIAPETVNAESVDVTNEALVDVLVTSDQSISANTWTTVNFDEENVDVTNSYDLANNNFTPPEDGHYEIHASVRLSGGKNSDTASLRFRNVTDSAVLRSYITSAGSDESLSVIINAIVELDAGKDYQVDVNNISSSDNVEGSSGRSSWLSIKRVLIG